MARRRPASPEPVRRPARAAAPLALVLALAACSLGPSASDDPFGVMAEEVIGSGYSHIAERYVEPVSIPDIALSGMEGVSHIDGKLAVARDKSRIVLTDGGAVVREFTAPQSEDPEPWADLTTHLLESARAASPAMRAADPEQIYEAVFDGALSHLDRFSRYANPVLAREQRGQRDGFGGIGITLDREANKLRVVSVVDDSPSARIGIEPQDVLVAIDGEPVGDLPLEEVVDRLRGPVDSPVHLTIARADEPQTREMLLRRALIVPPTVSYRAQGDIAYIRVSGFNQHTTTSLAAALHRAESEIGRMLHGVVIDLRGNPGGLLDQAVTVSDLFLSQGRILSTSGRHPDSNQTFDAAGSDLLHGLPVAILVNGGTASAAEVVAAALQDQGRAIVIGTTSYGKGTVQTVHRLPNDGDIIITWSRIHAPSGYTLNHVGVIPNICTSKLDAESPDSLMTVIDAVRSGRIDTVAARAALHSNRNPSGNEIRLMRMSCPPKNGDSKLDFEVARRVLEDGTLFARALQPATAPEIAKR
jgi:carboxyl-terminal processing protease